MDINVNSSFFKPLNPLALSLKILKGGGLPDDLKYISVIESDLWELAYSRSGAREPWQFMSHTARKYGLRVGS